MEYAAILLGIICLVAFVVYVNYKNKTDEKLGKTERNETTHVETEVLENSEDNITIDETNASLQGVFDTKNPIAKIFYILGCFVFIIGFFAAIIMEYHSFTTEGSVFISVLISSFLAGMMFIGLGEIIKLLDNQVSEAKQHNEYFKELIKDKK